LIAYGLPLSRPNAYLDERAPSCQNNICIRKAYLLMSMSVFTKKRSARRCRSETDIDVDVDVDVDIDVDVDVLTY
jgi:hypothetical protein